jgi:hypothetical protein
VTTIITAIELARALHTPAPSPDEYPEYSRGMAGIIAELYGFDQDSIGDIIRVIRRLDSVARFAVMALQTPFMSDPTPSERQIATRRELGDWLEAMAVASAGN